MNLTLSAALDYLEVAEQAVQTARAVDGDAARTVQALEVVAASLRDARRLLAEFVGEWAP